MRPATAQNRMGVCIPPRCSQCAFKFLRRWSQSGKTHIRSLAAGDRARIRRLTENYRRLRQARAALIKIHKQALEAIDRLAQALLLPPPGASPKRKPGKERK